MVFLCGGKRGCKCKCGECAQVNTSKGCECACHNLDPLTNEQLKTLIIKYDADIAPNVRNKNRNDLMKIITKTGDAKKILKLGVNMIQDGIKKDNKSWTDKKFQLSIIANRSEKETYDRLLRTWKGTEKAKAKSTTTKPKAKKRSEVRRLSRCQP